MDISIEEKRFLRRELINEALHAWRGRNLSAILFVVRMIEYARYYPYNLNVYHTS